MTTNDAQPIIHAEISCDECGENPIVGTRFKGKYREDFDLCSACIHDTTHELDDFVAFPTPVSRQTAREQTSSFPKTDSSTRFSKTLWGGGASLEDGVQAVIDALSGNNVNNTAIEFLHLHLMCFPQTERSPDLRQYQLLGEAIAESTHLRYIHLHMCFGNRANGCGDTIVQPLAQGIQDNTSLEKVFWTVPLEYRRNNEISGRRVWTALRDLIRHNTTLKGLYLMRTCRTTEQQETVDATEDAFTRFLIREGLQHNQTLKYFRMDGFHVFSATTKQLMLQVVESNRNLHRVYAKFENDSSDDFCLQVLLAANRGKWIERISNVDATLNERIRVMAEARSSMGSDDAGVVASGYLIRSCPDLCKLD